jgi:hypothetical protein
MTSPRQPRIALLVAPETSASVLFGLYDVLLSVGPMWPDMTAADPCDALLEVPIVAASREPFRCFGTSSSSRTRPSRTSTMWMR